MLMRESVRCSILEIIRLDYFMNGKLLQSVEFEWEMNGKLLPSVEFEKDLGLNKSENLQWAMHIKKIVNKAKSVIGWLQELGI